MSTIKVDTIATRTGSGNITASNTIAGTSATLSGTLTSTGLITASAGVAIGGTGSANTLDDYEEGTFTPVLADASSGGTAASITSAMGDYTKVGNLVFVNIVFVNINTSGLTSSNQVYVTGLPFVSKTRTLSGANISQHFVIRGDQLNVSSDCYGLVGVAVSGGSHLQVNENRDNVADSAFTIAGIVATTADMFISGCYIAD
tara:strand:+ start:316 stop:921 length:606 start_codon:yes stop_codon:yes gene_type:complete